MPSTIAAAQSSFLQPYDSAVLAPAIAAASYPSISPSALLPRQRHPGDSAQFRHHAMIPDLTSASATDTLIPAVSR